MAITIKVAAAAVGNSQILSKTIDRVCKARPCQVGMNCIGAGHISRIQKKSIVATTENSGKDFDSVQNNMDS